MQNSKVDNLPDDVKSWLEEELVAKNFGSYDELIAGLRSKGFEISRASLGRWGKSFKDRMEAIKRRMEMARAATEYLGDDEGAMNDYLQRVMQNKLLDVVEQLETMDIDPRQLAQLTRAISDLGRATISQKKYAAEIREKAIQAATEVEEIVTAEGMGIDSVKKIKSKILGIEL